MSPRKTTLEPDPQVVLEAYLAAVVAIAKCLGEVCPAAGDLYRERLLKMPRRLGFDATPEALRQSRQALETDLAEYAQTARDWIDAGANHAEQLLDHLGETETVLSDSSDLLIAQLDEMANHLRASAEVDNDEQLRANCKRYAAGFAAYARKARTEKQATIAGLRRRREEIGNWLLEATLSSYSDPETGLPNRSAALRRIDTHILKEPEFCVILMTAKGVDGPRIKQIADSIAKVIRPYDVIFRWSPEELITIFEASIADVTGRANQIAGWIPEITVSVIDHKEKEPAVELVARISAKSFAAA